MSERMIVRKATGMPLEACERFLLAHRKMHDAGLRIPHPEDAAVEFEQALPQRIEEWNRSGLILPKHLQGPRRTGPGPRIVREEQ